MDTIETKDGIKKIYVSKGKEAFVYNDKKIIHRVKEGNTLIAPSTCIIKIGTKEEVDTSILTTKTAISENISPK